MTKHKLIFHFICGLKLSIYHKIVQVRNDSFDYTKYFFTSLTVLQKLDPWRSKTENILYTLSKVSSSAWRLELEQMFPTRTRRERMGFMVIMTLQPIIRSAFENTFSRRKHPLYMATLRGNNDSNPSRWEKVFASGQC